MGADDIHPCQYCPDSICVDCWDEDYRECLAHYEEHIRLLSKMYDEMESCEKATIVIPCDRPRGALPLAAVLIEKEPVKQIIHNYCVPPLSARKKPVRGPLTLAAALMN